MDVEHGKGVDLMIDPLKPLPIRDSFSDITLSSSQMEHDKFFWKTFLELVRITKNGGYIYVSAPSNGKYHSYPIDCWRFYPEAGLALAEWATVNGFQCTLIESFTAGRMSDDWNDYVGIFQKCLPEEASPAGFISDHFKSYNVRKFGSNNVTNFSEPTEDFILLTEVRQRVTAQQNEIRALTEKIQALEHELRTAKAQDGAGREATE